MNTLKTLLIFLTLVPLSACGAKSQGSRGGPGQPDVPTEEAGEEKSLEAEVHAPESQKDVRQITYSCRTGNHLSIVNEPGRDAVYWGDGQASCKAGYDHPAADAVGVLDLFKDRKIEAPAGTDTEFSFSPGLHFLTYDDLNKSYRLDAEIQPQLPVGSIDTCKTLELSMTYKVTLAENQGFALKEARLGWTRAVDSVKKTAYWVPMVQEGLPAAHDVQGAMMESFAFYLHCDWTNASGLGL